MMRGSTRMAIALLIAVLFASACSNLSPDSLAFVDETPERQASVIRVATASRTGLTAAISAWEREHPTAEVVVDLRPSDEHHALMLEGRAEGRAPDIVMFDAEFSSTFRNRTDLFVDLGALGAETHAEESVAWRWQQGVADDGTIVGLPTDAGGLAVAYRIDLLAQNLSRDLESAETWCELIAVGDRYSDHTNRAFLPEADGIFDAIVNQAPSRFHNADGRLIYSTNPAVRTAWDYTMRALGERPLFEDPCPDNTDILRISANMPSGSDAWKDGLRENAFAAVLAPSAMLETLQETAPATAESWRVTSLPGRGGGNIGGSHLAIHRDSAHPELAYDLIAYLVGPSTQLQVFRDGGDFPAAQSLYSDPDLRDYRNPFFGDSPIGEIYRDSIRAYNVAPEGPEYQLILDEYRAAVSRVESGNQTPQEAWDEALWRIELFLR